jgi:hypothetical protein
VDSKSCVASQIFFFAQLSNKKGFQQGFLLVLMRKCDYELNLELFSSEKRK